MKKKRVLKKRPISIIIALMLFFSTNILFIFGIAINNQEEASELNIYFYPLVSNNAEYNGDSCIIVIDDVQILVDAGARANSSLFINDAIDKVITQKDLVWDFVIATHRDEDHIAAFSTATNINADTGVLKHIKETKTSAKKRRTIQTFIDFDITKDATVEIENKEKYFQTEVYKRYKNRRDEFIKEKTIIEYYSASQCLWEERGVERYQNARTEFILKEQTKNSPRCTLTILNNKYCYELPESKASDSAKVNVMSVCFLIEYGEDSFLFTGDLEEFDSGNEYEVIGGEGQGGETLLLENNPKLKNGVDFYKVAHHGSKTSSSESFVDAIRPSYVVFPVVAGSHDRTSENPIDRSPSQTVISNLFKYTDYMMMPKYSTGKGKSEIYYGEILISSHGKGLQAFSTNEYLETNGVEWKGEQFFPVKGVAETQWFKTNRNAKVGVHVFDNFKSEKSAYKGHCTLVKYGHIDILIDCGVWASDNSGDIVSTAYIDKVKQYCVDNILEYVIITDEESDSLQQMVDVVQNGEIVSKGILNTFQIETIIDGGFTIDPSKDAVNSIYKSYNKYLQSFKSDSQTKDKYFSASKILEEKNGLIAINKNLKIEILENPNYGKTDDNDVCFTIKFEKSKMLFLGDLTSSAQEKVIKDIDLKDIVFFSVPNYGEQISNSEELYSKISDKNEGKWFIIVNSSYSSTKMMDKSFCDNILNNSLDKNVYSTITKNEKGEYKQSCGDISFYIEGDKKYLDVTNEMQKLHQTEYYDFLQ